jgi:hypothetical protein
MVGTAHPTALEYACSSVGLDSSWKLIVSVLGYFFQKGSASILQPNLQIYYRQRQHSSTQPTDLKLSTKPLNR